MKHLKPLLLVAALFLMIMPMACKKSNTTPAPQTATVSMKFKFNGTAETATMINATYYKSLGTVQIIGMLADHKQALNLGISNVKAGTFDVVKDNLIVSFSTSTDFDHMYLGDTGKVVITTFTSDTIAGTFEFSGTNSANQLGTVTEGSFSAKLITQ